MSEPAHPSALALDSLAAGDPVPEAQAHVEMCATCTEYVETVRAEAAAFANAAPTHAFLANLEALAAAPVEDSPEGPDAETTRAEGATASTEKASARTDAIQVEEIRVEPRGPSNDVDAEAPRVSRITEARTKRARVFNLVYAAVPLALVAAALFVLRPTGTPGADGFPTAPTETTLRLKGPPVLAVVRERQGNQERFTSAIAVAPDDRLRLELTVDREGMYEAGLLGEDGSWLMLLSPSMLTPGAHFSEKAAHLDDRPTPGWMLAGPPEDVARARATREFTGLAILAVKVAPSP
jgi:hypothetical protein